MSSPQPTVWGGSRPGSPRTRVINALNDGKVAAALTRQRVLNEVAELEHALWDQERRAGEAERSLRHAATRAEELAETVEALKHTLSDGTAEAATRALRLIERTGYSKTA